jgi:hypothetical protein
MSGSESGAPGCGCDPPADEARVPREDRDSWPLVFAGDRLAWVPGIAVDSDLRGVKGEPALHVAISPMPGRSQSKVVRLETPISPRGEFS